MKVNLLISLIVLLSACQEQELSVKDKTSPSWTIEWQNDGHKAFGTLDFNENHTAHIIVPEPDHVFFNQPQDVLFTWQDTGTHFILTRIDNGFEMSYNITDRHENALTLAFQDDIIVKIYR